MSPATIREYALYWRLQEYAMTLPRPEVNPDVYGANGLYLSRWIVHDFPEEKAQIRLHHIIRPDEDEELHNHPWGDPHRLYNRRGEYRRLDGEARASKALILFGGYEEERRIGSNKIWYIGRCRYSPGDTNVLYSDDFHRIDKLLHPLGTWSLFWTAPKTQSWQFWNRVTDVYTPWRTFIEEKERR